MEFVNDKLINFIKDLGRDKIKNTLRWLYWNEIYSIDISYIKEIFAMIVKNNRSNGLIREHQ